MSSYPPGPPSAAPPYPSEAPVQRNGLAIAALVCGIVGFCIPLVGIVGAVLGIVALVKASSDPRRTGTGMAIAGIVLGVLSLLSAIAIAIALLLPALAHARDVARQTASSAQLRQIAAAMQTYAVDNNDEYPEAGADLKSRLSIYVMPGAWTSPLADQGWTGPSWIYVADARAVGGDQGVLLFENPELPGNSVVLVFVDGHTEIMPDDVARARLAPYSDLRTPEGQPWTWGAPAR